MKKLSLIIFTSLLISLQAFAEEKIEKEQSIDPAIAETVVDEATTQETEEVKEEKTPILEKLKEIDAKRVRIYEFNPIKNPDALITLIEFNDLSCKECLTKAQEVYNLIPEEEKDNIKYIYKHVNNNNNKLVNQTTVYGLIASKLNKFWEFKDEITQNEYKTNEDMISAILTVGISKEDLYDNLMLNSDIFYKNIDADNKYAKSIRGKVTPMFYLDGYKIEEDIEKSEIAEYIKARKERLKEIKIQEYNKYNMGKF